MYPTDEEIVEWLDPDWRDHFGRDIDRARDFYEKWAPEQWAIAIREIEGEDIHPYEAGEDRDDFEGVDDERV